MDIENKKTDNGELEAIRLAEEEAGIKRKPKGFSAYFIPTIAICWSLFQLSIAKWVTINSTYTRAIHLGFALLILTPPHQVTRNWQMHHSR